jgi:UDPglucose--hexose-1-phosphate uridylyltransferase
MHSLKLRKPDGRNLILYSRKSIASNISAPSPNSSRVQANPHLRWHPLLGEWVAYASHRQDRTFLPPPEYNPFLPTLNTDCPTELPKGEYDIAVFENLFPALSLTATSPPALSTDTLPGSGVCEVVVFTQDPQSTLGSLPLDHLELLFEVWTERTLELSKNPAIRYVLPFENRGVAVGVTLHHPHGQLYAYPVVPPIPARQLAQGQAHFERTGRGLLADLIASEIRDEKRILYLGKGVTAFIPVCARYPYEVWIAPSRRVASLIQLTSDERKDFARALKTILMKYDHLWKKPFPYLMVLHQAPTNQLEHPGAHLHIEFYPPHRTETRLKYLAGTELGAGMFANDSLPEEKAAELRRVEVCID